MVQIGGLLRKKICNRVGFGGHNEGVRCALGQQQATSIAALCTAVVHSQLQSRGVALVAATTLAASWIHKRTHQPGNTGTSTTGG